MNNYTNMYLVKVPMAFLVRSDEQYKETCAFDVLETFAEAALENGDTVVFGKTEIELVF